jgi:nucleotide-binding universal stress UspA family protein
MTAQTQPGSSGLSRVKSSSCVRDHGPVAARGHQHPSSLTDLGSTGRIDVDSSALPWIGWPSPVASRAGGGGEPKRLLIPYCESSTAEAALRMAADLCSAMNADAWVLHVRAWDPMPGGRLFIETPSDVLAIVGTAMTYLRGRGVASSSIVRPARRERIAEVIVAESQRLAVDSIVLGTHGRGSLRASLLGSTSLAVVRRATCPVILVRIPRNPRSLLRGWRRRSQCQSGPGP